MQDYEYFLSSVNNIKGIGKKTAELFLKKRILNIFDLLLHIPKSKIETSKTVNINDLQIGKTQSIKLTPKKYNFPRIRNLPNRVNCLSSEKKIDCIFFNSYEGYIKKILPINQEVIVYGKINYYKGKYQITNPKLVSETEEGKIKDIKNYSLTDGLSISKYNTIIEEVLKNMPVLKEWHDKNIIKKFNNVSWNEAIKRIHSEDFENLKNSYYLKRLIFDEVMSNFLLSSQIRNKIKKIKKKEKKFKVNDMYKYLKKLNFNLTNDQYKAVDEINKDLKSKQKMFRLIQGDVGSGKTIVSLISALNVINSGYQVALMAPTEILATQHYNFSSKFFGKNIKVELLTGKTEYSCKKKNS